MFWGPLWTLACLWPRPCLELKAKGAYGSLSQSEHGTCPRASPKGRRRQQSRPAELARGSWGSVRRCFCCDNWQDYCQGHTRVRWRPGSPLGHPHPASANVPCAEAEKPGSQRQGLLLQVATLSTKPTRSSFWSAHTSTFVATPPALALKSSEVSFVFWGPWLWPSGAMCSRPGPRCTEEASRGARARGRKAQTLSRRKLCARAHSGWCGFSFGPFWCPGPFVSDPKELLRCHGGTSL